jgi:transcriptional regulator with XRE-family HTH domain
MADDPRQAPHRKLLADNLRRLRAAVPISQEDLANSVSLSRSYLSAVERAEKAPTIDVLARLSAGLGVPMWRLLFDESAVGTTSKPNSGVKQTRR